MCYFQKIIDQKTKLSRIGFIRMGAKYTEQDQLWTSLNRMAQLNLKLFLVPIEYFLDVLVCQEQ